MGANEGIIDRFDSGMLFAGRVILCALVTMAPVPSGWMGLGSSAASVEHNALSAAVLAVAQADGHVVRSPAGGNDREDDGGEEATLAADDHRMPPEPAHGGVFQASDERTIQYPSDRPPRDPDDLRLKFRLRSSV